MTQISLCIRPIRPEFSLCAQRIAKDPSFLHPDGQGADQVRVLAGRTGYFVGFVMQRLTWHMIVRYGDKWVYWRKLFRKLDSNQIPAASYKTTFILLLFKTKTFAWKLQ